MDDLSDGEVPGDETSSFTRSDLLPESDYSIGRQGVVPIGYEQQEGSTLGSSAGLSARQSDLLYEDRFASEGSRFPLLLEGEYTQPWTSNGFGPNYHAIAHHAFNSGVGFVDPLPTTDDAVRASSGPFPVLTHSAYSRPEGIIRHLGPHGDGQEFQMYEFCPNDGGQSILFANEPIWDYSVGRWLSSSASSDHRGLRWGDSASAFSPYAGPLPSPDGSEGGVREMGTHTYLDQ